MTDTVDWVFWVEGSSIISSRQFATHCCSKSQADDLRMGLQRRLGTGRNAPRVRCARACDLTEFAWLLDTHGASDARR